MNGLARAEESGIVRTQMAPVHRVSHLSRIRRSALYRSCTELHALIACIYVCVYFGMNFAWDPDKSESNLLERGFDFDFASLIFEGPTLERADDREDYGEARIVAIGLVEDLALTVVYTDRRQESGDTVRRIISARRSSSREREAYNETV